MIFESFWSTAFKLYSEQITYFFKLEVKIQMSISAHTQVINTPSTTHCDFFYMFLQATKGFKNMQNSYITFLNY